MRAAVGFALVVALAATAASGQPEPGERGPDRPRPTRFSYADPSAVIAADSALSRIAREKGEARALRDRAAEGAVVFVPGPVDALTWLKRSAAPSASARWQPRNVWMSCDGAFAVTRGAWTRGAEGGEYVAVWQRQKKGDWKWLLREEAPPGDIGEAPEMIAGQVAECFGLPRRRPLEEVLPDATNSSSRDHSLRWSVQVDASCGRIISVQAWDGKALVSVFEARHAAPATGCS